MSMDTQEKWLVGLGVSTVVVILVLIFLQGINGCNGSPGDGEKIGQIVRLTQEGLVWKTHEGQLIRGGMNGGSGAFGTVPWEFTIEDPGLADKAMKYMQAQTEVLVKYRIELFYFKGRSASSGHFVTSIEPAPKTP